MLPFIASKTMDTTHKCTLYRDGVPFVESTFIEERQRRGPLYKTKRDGNGWRPPKPYKRCVIQAHDRGGSVRGVYAGKTYTFTGEPANLTLWRNYNFNRILNTEYYASWDANDLFRANTEVMLKLRDQKVNYGEALAEARKTIAHLGSTARTLLRSILYARKGKWGKVLKELRIDKRHRFKSGKEASGRWLELQFGWTPLMSDIKGTMELLQTGFRTKDYTFSAVRQIRTPLTGRDVMSPIVDNPFNRIDGSGFRVTKVKVYAKVRDDDVHALTQIGLTDPLQVAWALVPFSFVIDWFLPVGSILEALGAAKGLEFVSGTRTTALKFRGVAYTRLNPSVVKNQVGHFETDVAVEGMERIVLTSFPSPMLYYKSPFSISHGVSALALLRQLTH